MNHQTAPSILAPLAPDFQPATFFSRHYDSFGEFLKSHGHEAAAECFIPGTVNELVVAGEIRVKVLQTIDSWFGVTYREDRACVIASIRQLIDSGAYPEKLWL